MPLTDYTVIYANVHDSQETNKLIDEKDKVIYADKGYYNEKENNGLPNRIV